MNKREYQLAAGHTQTSFKNTGIPCEVSAVKLGGPIRSWTVKVIFNGQNTRYFFERGGQWMVLGDGVGDQNVIGPINAPVLGGLTAAVLEGYIDLLRALCQPYGVMERAIAPTDLEAESLTEIRGWLLSLMNELDVLSHDPSPRVGIFAAALYTKQLDLMQKAEDEAEA